jgi:hypothetical protein
LRFLLLLVLKATYQDQIDVIAFFVQFKDVDLMLVKLQLVAENLLFLVVVQDAEKFAQLQLLVVSKIAIAFSKQSKDVELMELLQQEHAEMKELIDAMLNVHRLQVYFADVQSRDLVDALGKQPEDVEEHLMLQQLTARMPIFKDAQEDVN